MDQFSNSFQGSGYFPLFKPVHWGLVSSCRNTKRTDNTGKMLYQGDWFRLRKLDYGLTTAIVENGIEWVKTCYTD